MNTIQEIGYGSQDRHQWQYRWGLWREVASRGVELVEAIFKGKNGMGSESNTHKVRDGLGVVWL